MKIEIESNNDQYECETCGMDWAQGGIVKVDGEVIIDLPAVAHCYGGQSYSEDDLLVMALKKMGIDVFVDGERYHVTCHNDEYHGGLEDE